jgi:hypothetical protein
MYRPNLLIRNMWILFGWLALVPVLVIACKLSGSTQLSAPEVLNTPVYVPPTAANFPTPTPMGGAPAVQEAGLAPVEPQEEKPSPTPSCVDNLLWVEDLTVPDGSLVDPGSSLDKRWKVQNNGTCNWDKDYRVKLVGGPSLDASEEQALYPARSGADALIRMVFTAPQEPGAYRSAWQAFTPGGAPFGDPFYIDIVVQSP